MMKTKTLPKYITKFCRPVDRKRMLRGSFKIGLLSEYRKIEGQISETGLMMDKDEGVVRDEVVPLPRHHSVLLSNLRANSISLDGNTKGVVIRTNVDTNVFCATAGSYCEKTHRNILFGERDYKANPNYTAFIILDTEKVYRALFDAVSNNYKTKIIPMASHVNYGERRRTISANRYQSENSIGDKTESKSRTFFTKPALFTVENEMRFVFELSKSCEPLQPIYTSNAPAKIQTALQNAIVNDGNDAPLFT
jgi:hypothetical protein